MVVTASCSVFCHSLLWHLLFQLVSMIQFFHSSLQMSILFLICDESEHRHDQPQLLLLLRIVQPEPGHIAQTQQSLEAVITCKYEA